MLPKLKDAIWNDTIISMHYENWEGESRQFVLHPYSLVYKSGRWYLVGMDDDKQQVRTYRVSRIHEVEHTHNTFERDSQFNIIDYWQSSSEQFNRRVPEYPVLLRARPDTMIYFQHMMAGRYEVLNKDDVWIELRVTYTVFEEARTSVLGLGTAVEVIEPHTLHDAVVQVAQEIVDKYKSS